MINRSKLLVFRALRWGGLGTCLVITSLMMVNIGWSFRLPIFECVVIDSSRGSLALTYFHTETGIRPGTLPDSARAQVTNRNLGEGWTWGWQGGTDRTETGLQIWWGAAPLWLPLVLACIPTTLAWRTLLARHHARRLTTCNQCAYDTRGLRLNKNLTIVCPECGSKHAISPSEIDLSAPPSRYV